MKEQGEYVQAKNNKTMKENNHSNGLMIDTCLKPVSVRNNTMLFLVNNSNETHYFDYINSQKRYPVCTLNKQSSTNHIYLEHVCCIYIHSRYPSNVGVCILFI